MIDIQINPRQFEYDIQSLVQAFYIGHSFKINGQVEDAYRVLEVEFSDNAIIGAIYIKNQKLPVSFRNYWHQTIFLTSLFS